MGVFRQLFSWQAVYRLAARSPPGVGGSGVYPGADFVHLHPVGAVFVGAVELPCAPPFL
jgi:hypothetical protein